MLAFSLVDNVHLHHYMAMTDLLLMILAARCWRQQSGVPGAPACKVAYRLGYMGKLAQTLASVFSFYRMAWSMTMTDLVLVMLAAKRWRP